MFLLNKITYLDSILSIDVSKTDSSDFAFYVFSGSDRVGAKLYTKDSFSTLLLDLSENKVYCLKLFFRPNSVNTLSENEKITKKVYFVINLGVVKIFKEKILFEENNIKITEYDQKSEITFVTFNSAQTDKTSSPFAGDFILSNGWNLISIHKHNKNQYQDLSLELFSKYVKERVQNKSVYVYGTSLGGYCALYFGGTLNATIIAGAPMLPVHPTVNHPDYKDIEYKHIDLFKVPKTSKPVYIIYDPLESGDVRFINKQVLKLYPLSYFIPVKGGTHLVIKSLQQRKILKKIIFDLMGNKYFDAINRIMA